MTGNWKFHSQPSDQHRAGDGKKTNLLPVGALRVAQQIPAKTPSRQVAIAGKVLSNPSGSWSPSHFRSGR